MGSSDWKGWDGRFWRGGEGIKYIECHLSHYFGFLFLSLYIIQTYNPIHRFYSINKQTNKQTNINLEILLSFNQQHTHTHTNLLHKVQTQINQNGSRCFLYHWHVPRHRCWSHGRRQRNRSHPHRYHQRHRRFLRCPHLLLDLRKLRRSEKR